MVYDHLLLWINKIMTLRLLGIAEFFKKPSSAADQIQDFRKSIKDCGLFAEDRASQYDCVKHTSAKAKEVFLTITHEQNPSQPSKKLIYSKDLGQELQSLAKDLYVMGSDLEKSASSPFYSNSPVRNSSTLFLEDTNLYSNDESFLFFKIDVQYDCADLRRIAVHIYSLVALQEFFPSVVVDMIGMYLQEERPPKKNKGGEEQRPFVPPPSFMKRLICSLTSNKC